MGPPRVTWGECGLSGGTRPNHCATARVGQVCCSARDPFGEVIPVAFGDQSHDFDGLNIGTMASKAELEDTFGSSLPRTRHPEWRFSQESGILTADRLGNPGESDGLFREEPP